MASSDLLRVILASEIAEELWDSNEFYNHSLDDTAWVRDGYKVILPQAGGPQAVIKNPTVFPLTSRKRNDDAADYTLDKFALEPIHLEDESIDELLISYDKRKSILNEQKMNLDNSIAENFLDKWIDGIPSANIIRTTGTDSANYLADNATGTRKLMVKSDWTKLSRMLDKQKVPDDGKRVALCDPTLYDNLLNIDGFVNFQDRGLVDLIGQGYIGKLCGFLIKKRASGAVFNGSAVYKPFEDFTSAASDNLSVVAWHPNFVRRAKGEVKVYINEGKAEYLGSLMNASVRSGGAKARKDKKGIVALVQQA